jgi:ankyrin repeat protein
MNSYLFDTLNYTPADTPQYSIITKDYLSLIKTSFDPNKFDKNNITPLQLAVLMSDPESVSILLHEKLADPNIYPIISNSPIYYAVLRENSQIIKLLIEYNTRLTNDDKLFLLQLPTVPNYIKMFINNT